MCSLSVCLWLCPWLYIFDASVNAHLVRLESVCLFNGIETSFSLCRQVQRSHSLLNKGQRSVLDGAWPVVLINYNELFVNDPGLIGGV